MTTNNALNITESGIVANDGSGTFSGRTITGTSDFVDVADGTGVSGNPTVSIGSNFESTGMHGWNGSLIETASVVITSNGSTITCTVQRSGGGDLTAVFSDGYYDWDTTPADTVTLTAGTDTIPVQNFVYFLQSTKALTVSTTSFPSAEHVPLATVICQSAASLQTDGAYKVHNWTDHILTTTDQGHIGDLNAWIRNQNATWTSGVAQTYTITTNGGAADNVILTTAVGIVFQLHNHAFPAFTGTPDIYVINDSVTAYDKVTDLNALLTDSAGVSMSGKYFSLVIWGVVSEDVGDCKLFCNLPSGSYNNKVGVENDNDNFANFTIPTAYRGTGFLISEWKLRHQAAASGTWTSIDEIDLRGIFPAAVPTGVTSSPNEFVDSAFRVFDDGDDTKKIAFQASGITTANTRTLTVQDSDGTIALTSDFSTALALGGTVANTVKSTAITSDPAAATDSYVQFDESTVGKWRIGNDATDDSYRISQGSALGANDTFVMSSAGERTMPLQPAFLANLGGDDTDVTGDGTTYTLGTNVAFTEIFDQGGDFNTNGTFTSPVTGRYSLIMSVRMTQTANATLFNLSFVTSNRTYAALGGIPNLTTQQKTNSTIADMDAADTATFTTWMNGIGADTADVSSTTNTHISGCLLV